MVPATKVNLFYNGTAPRWTCFIRWEQGQLRWHDPATGRHILTYDDQRVRAEGERSRANSERAARLTAEARVRELEERLTQQDL